MKDHGGDGAVAERRGRRLVGVDAQAERALVPGDGAVEVLDGEVDGAEGQGGGEGRGEHGNSIARRGAGFPMANPRGYMDFYLTGSPAPLASCCSRTPRSGRGRRAARGHRTGTTTTSCYGRGRAPGSHLIDGERSAVRPLHRDRDRPRAGARLRGGAVGLSGAVVRFGGELLFEAPPAWLVGGRGALTVDVPPGEADALEATIARSPPSRAAGGRAAASTSSGTCCPRCCCGSSAGTTTRAPSARDEARVALPPLRRAARARIRSHHDAAQYADALAVPPRRSSRALGDGDRPHDQAARHRPRDAGGGRLLRFTDLTRRRGRVPRRLRGPAVFLARVQAPLRRGAERLPRASSTVGRTG